MKTLLTTIVLTITSFFALAQTALPVKHVLIIGIDGLSTLGVRKSHTPHLDELIKSGTHTLRANAVMPTNSSPNWASMIMGAKPKQHRVKSNGWKVEDIRNNSLCGQSKGEIWPTVFRAVREQRPNADISIFADWGDFNRLVENNVCSIKTHPNGADSTALLATHYIAIKRPLLTFVHLDLVDHAGHEFGHRSAEYFAAVHYADSLVGNFITTLRLANLLDSTVVLITSDHGGRGHGHWGFAPKVKRVPWIIAGPNVKSNFTLTEPFQTYDTAATIAYLLGVQSPACWIGHAAKSAFIFPMTAIQKNNE
jgi:predicted AlkP superfamily pyrophosphatase or phosphodiesterase